MRIPLIFLSCILVLTTSCSDRGRRDKTSDYDYAISLMDAGQFNSAIDVLSGRLERSDVDQRARVLLAAAYAGRAGVQLTDFIDLAKELTSASRKAAEFFDENGFVAIGRLKQKAKQSGEKDLLVLLDKLYRALFHINQFLRAFDLVPTITSPLQLQDIETAIQVLSEDDALTGGPVLYRGLLKIVRFKYDLRHQYRFNVLKNCKLDAKLLLFQIRNLHFDVKTILLDITAGTLNRKKHAQIAKETHKLDEALAQVLDYADLLRRHDTLDVGKCD